MKYCKDCDESFPDDNSFCPKCGKGLGEKAYDETSGNKGTELRVEIPKSTWKIFGSIMIILLILCITAIVWKPWNKTGGFLQGGIDREVSTVTTASTITESTTTTIDETKYDLSEFPYPFVINGKMNSIIVIGNDAPPTDAVMGVDIAASLAGIKEGKDETKKVVPVTNAIAMLDIEVSNLTKQPMILIGGPDVNKLAASVLGVRYPSSMSSAGLPEDAIVIKIINSAFGGEYPALIVDGCDDESTRLAGDMIINYKNYNFKGDDFIADGFCSGKTTTTNKAYDTKEDGKYSMIIGDSVTVEGKRITFENVASTGAVMVKIDGTLYTVAGTEIYEGLEITVEDYFYMDSIADRGATLTIKKSNEVKQVGNNLINIRDFSSVKEGNMIRFYFVLVNEYGSVVTGNGQASLKITDNLNNILYSEDFGFSSSDFVDYEYSLTGQKIGKAFQWKVPFSDIKKGFATYGQGKANLKLELSDGRIFTDDTSVEIPTYTEEEIMELYGNKYLEKSISIDKTIRKSSNYGDFEVTVVRAGEFTHLKYGTWGDEVTHFRIDIKVRNVGSEKGTFYGHDAVILDNSGNQYENNYFDDKFDGGDIYPDVTKGGYLIFDELKKKPDSVKLIIENGWELSDDYKMIPITYEFNIKFE